MTREKKKAPAPSHGVTAATRRAKMERAMHYSDSVWRALNPLKAPPKVKHKSYFEAVDNTDKKKKLEFEVTTNRTPPPGYEFIPTGHPELSKECKEQSRECDAMFFIVSISKNTSALDHHMNRLGYHFRYNIVEAARATLRQKGIKDAALYVPNGTGIPEPIPTSQREINDEADAVLRDLFPRIPNTDRQEIINHAFKKDATFNGDKTVGMAKDLTLARRVQLAALAHIRHTHTRYDALLKESDWANARKAVEKPCLDIIVKWRGDEETGRDQLDEILREVIEISDTESESESESYSTEDDSIRVSQRPSATVAISDRGSLRQPPPLSHRMEIDLRPSSPILTGSRPLSKQHRVTKAEKKTARQTQQRFKRYAAAAEALAHSSNHDGHPDSHSAPGNVATSMEGVRANPVMIPYRTTPNAAAQGSYNPRIPYGHSEVQKQPISRSNGFTEDRVAGASHAPTDGRIQGSTEQFIRIPDAQRPKVGPYSANRQNLQDVALPSIEPQSPDGLRAMHDVSQGVHREPQQFTEVPSVIPRTTLMPGEPGYPSRSPGNQANDDEMASKRRRVTTYFHDDFHRDPNPSYVRVPASTQEDSLRRPQLQYLPEQRQLISRVPERITYEEVPWPRSGQEIRVLGSEDGRRNTGPLTTRVPVDGPFLTRSRAPDAPVYQGNLRVATRPEVSADTIPSSRGHPIIFDEERGYERRRGSPARQTYGATAPTGRLVYVEESPGYIRRGPVSRYEYISHVQPASYAYQETPRRYSPTISLQPLTIESSRRYSVERDNIRGSGPDRVAANQPASTYHRRTQAQMPAAPVRESLPVSRSQDYYSHPHFDVVQHAVSQETSGDVIYGGTRPLTRPTETHYERGHQQPFPVNPPRSSYAEVRNPSTNRHLSGYPDIIYVG